MRRFMLVLNPSQGATDMYIFRRSDPGVYKTVERKWVYHQKGSEDRTLGAAWNVVWAGDAA